MSQLSIDEQQYEALKQRAKALRISEEELVRRAIDAVLTEPRVEPTSPDHLRAAAEFMEAARVAQRRVGAEPYRFCREEVEAILSEDFNAGAAIEGVTFINPFAPTFVVQNLE